jgi:hypothetical protein
MNFKFIYFYLAYDKLFGKRCNYVLNNSSEDFRETSEILLHGCQLYLIITSVVAIIL